MRRVFIYLLLIILTVSGCGSDTVNSSQYEGNDLKIGVIGDAPTIREDNIEFVNISFSDLKKIDSLKSRYNAIFIMEEYFDEASEAKYAKIYKNSGVAFFFIDSSKSYIPFVIEELSYESCTKTEDLMYATGYFGYGDKYRFWKYGLYNDKRNETNIKDVYSRIFTTIDIEIRKMN